MFGALNVSLAWPRSGDQVGGSEWHGFPLEPVLRCSGCNTQAAESDAPAPDCAATAHVADCREFALRTHGRNVWNYVATLMLRRSMLIQDGCMNDSPERVYFTVLDQAGKAYPAVEYWAGLIDERAPAYQGVPLRKFIKLIGPDEPLQETGRGVFLGATSGIVYTRLPSAA